MGPKFQPYSNNYCVFWRKLHERHLDIRYTKCVEQIFYWWFYCEMRTTPKYCRITYSDKQLWNKVLTQIPSQTVDENGELRTENVTGCSRSIRPPSRSSFLCSWPLLSQIASPVYPSVTIASSYSISVTTNDAGCSHAPNQSDSYLDKLHHPKEVSWWHNPRRAQIQRTLKLRAFIKLSRPVMIPICKRYTW